MLVMHMLPQCQCSRIALLVLSLRGCCDSQHDVHSGCPQLVHHAAKFVSVPTLLAAACATLHFLQAELRGVVHWLNLLRHCEASVKQLTRDAEKLNREHAASADEAVLLHRQAKEKKLLKEQSDMKETIEKVLESLQHLQRRTGMSCTVEHQQHSSSFDLLLVIGATWLLSAQHACTNCLLWSTQWLVRPNCEVANLASSCSQLYGFSWLHVGWVVAVT